MITVHLIFNAHLDPIWLWPWQMGLDEALATCRSACDRLDAHPEVIFTRGEAWVYEQIEKTDPELFERIRRHVRSGQWEITGGWWIQPDCNAPSGFAMEKQIALGKEYFLSRFGLFPKTAYNVDSFGHAATLPGYMRAAGQDSYVMMRPQEHEARLPARLFRWRGYEGGPEVTTFRIAGGYTCREVTEKHILAAMMELPAGVEHTMCFVGVGDHGGGPTEGQIRWLKEHANSIDGCRLVFSSPRRFFEAIADRIPSLPLVTGELQMHAIGCYSVCRPVKTALRKSEHLLRQAELMNARSSASTEFSEAWKRVCFNQFHDTLGGTCLPSAYRQVLAQLGYAEAVADDALQIGLRRKLRELPDDELQRVVAFNASDLAFDGWVEVEPWIDWRGWEPHWRVVDEQGSDVPYQVMAGEASAVGGKHRLLIHSRIEPCEWRVWRLATERSSRPAMPARVQCAMDAMSNDCDVTWTPTEMWLGKGPRLALPRLDLIEDCSDTWSHSIDRYGEEPVASAVWESARMIDRGPLMASLTQRGKIGQSHLLAEWRVYAGCPYVELLLSVHWLESFKVLKLCLPLPQGAEDRVDGIMGGHVRRVNDGAERPIRDWMFMEMGNGERLGVVCPDVYAADVTPRRLRLTLLRSPVMVHHDPHPATATPRPRFSDQGEHQFRFRFWGGERVGVETLEVDAMSIQRPPIIADLTRGMPMRLQTP